jgi:hypothetical protein
MSQKQSNPEETARNGNLPDNSGGTTRTVKKTPENGKL